MTLLIIATIFFVVFDVVLDLLAIEGVEFVDQPGFEFGNLGLELGLAGQKPVEYGFLLAGHGTVMRTEPSRMSISKWSGWGKGFGCSRPSCLQRLISRSHSTL